MNEWITEGAPESGRRATLVEALEELHKLVPEQAHIVEVGTARNLSPEACTNDGWATRVFAWYATETGGRLTTIDNRRLTMGRSREVCGGWADVVTFVCADAVVFADELRGVDLLYMDGPSDAKMHLGLYRALPEHPRLVLFDDIVLPGEPVGVWPKWPPEGVTEQWAVKGALAIPAMLEDGYRIVFAKGRQVLLQAP